MKLTKTFNLNKTELLMVENFQVLRYKNEMEHFIQITNDYS